MKRLVVFLLFVVIFQSQGVAQESEAKIGISYSAFGKAVVLNSQDIIGGPNLDGKRSYAFGLSYEKPIFKWLDIETGLDLSNHKIEVTSLLNPDFSSEHVITKTMTTTILSIPVSLRVNFLKHLFVNGGAMIDMDLSGNSAISGQNGLGLMAGFGAKYNFNSGLSIFVNPYAKFHALLMIPAEKGYKSRINETGIRIGITYELSRLKR